MREGKRGKKQKGAPDVGLGLRFPHDALVLGRASRLGARQRRQRSAGNQVAARLVQQRLRTGAAIVSLEVPRRKQQRSKQTLNRVFACKGPVFQR